MEFLKNLVPEQFELSNLKEDIEQEHILTEQHPGIVNEMKFRMLSLRNEMIKEGDDWYKE